MRYVRMQPNPSQYLLWYLFGMWSALVIRLLL